MTDWQPIETAPKDGESFLAVDANNGPEYRVVYYDDDPLHLPYIWHVEDAGAGFNHHENFFTHWMPLPEPPKEAIQ